MSLRRMSDRNRMSRSGDLSKPKLDKRLFTESPVSVFWSLFDLRPADLFDNRADARVVSSVSADPLGRQSLLSIIATETPHRRSTHRRVILASVSNTVRRSVHTLARAA